MKNESIFLKNNLSSKKIAAEKEAKQNSEINKFVTIWNTHFNDFINNPGTNSSFTFTMPRYFRSYRDSDHSEKHWCSVENNKFRNKIVSRLVSEQPEYNMDFIFTSECWDVHGKLAYLVNITTIFPKKKWWRKVHHPWVECRFSKAESGLC